MISENESLFIYLEPAGGPHDECEGRTWCNEDVYHKGDYFGETSTKYVLEEAAVYSPAVARAAVRLFDAEYVGQNQQQLWMWAVSEAKKLTEESKWKK